MVYQVETGLEQAPFYQLKLKFHVKFFEKIN